MSSLRNMFFVFTFCVLVKGYNVLIHFSPTGGDLRQTQLWEFWPTSGKLILRQIK